MSHLTSCKCTFLRIWLTKSLHFPSKFYTKRIDSLNHDSFWKWRKESRIDNSQNLANRAGPNRKFCTMHRGTEKLKSTQTHKENVNGVDWGKHEMFTIALKPQKKVRKCVPLCAEEWLQDWKVAESLLLLFFQVRFTQPVRHNLEAYVVLYTLDTHTGSN